MQRYICFSLIVGLSVLFSCKKEDTATQVSDDANFTLITDRAVLSQSVTYINEPLELKGTEGSTTSPFTLVARVASKVVNGVRLSTTSVLIRGNIAYVTCHERGDGFCGSIEAWDLTDLHSPKFSLSCPNYDFNACDVNANGTKLYIAGASNKKGAVLIVYTLNSNGVPAVGSKQELEFSDAASANGVIQAAGYLFVSAGHTNGGLFAFGVPYLNALGKDLYDGASYSTANGRTIGKMHMALEGGDNAKLHVYVVGKDDPTYENVFPVGSISHQNVEPEYEYSGKGVIFIKNDDDVCYMAMGKYGMKAINIYTGELVYESPADMITYGNTNGVSADDDYIYMANGAQGLYIYKPSTGTSLEKIGYYDPDVEPASANFVQSNNSFIFVAFGQEGGMMILSK